MHFYLYLCSMRTILEVKVQEGIAELKDLQKRYPHKFRALQMLIILRKTPRLRKLDLASQTGASDRSIHKWRNGYLREGITAILKDDRGGKKQAAIAAKVHDALSKRLTDPKGGFRSFIEIQQWLSKEFDIDMNYQAVNKYVKRKFGARLKISRKSHVPKSPADEAVFKTPV